MRDVVEWQPTRAHKVLKTLALGAVWFGSMGILIFLIAVLI